MKEPNDFYLQDGDTLSKCWHRHGAVYIFQNKLTTRDLRSLALWCADAANYLEWVDTDQKTPVKSSSTSKPSTLPSVMAKSSTSRLRSGKR